MMINITGLVRAVGFRSGMRLLLASCVGFSIVPSRTRCAAENWALYRFTDSLIDRSKKTLHMVTVCAVVFVGVFCSVRTITHEPLYLAS